MTQPTFKSMISKISPPRTPTVIASSKTNFDILYLHSYYRHLTKRLSPETTV